MERCQEENIALSQTDIAAAIEWAGGHPYLTQQLLNCIFDDYQKAKFCSVEHLQHKLLRFTSVIFLSGGIHHDPTAWEL